MFRLDSTPLGVELFGNETAVTMMRQVLTAKKTTLLKQFRLHLLLDFATRHQIHEPALVNIPVTLVLLLDL